MSASEIALFSLSRFQIRSLKDRFKPTHKQIKRLLADPAGLLMTILISNEVINISITTLIARSTAKMLEGHSLGFQILVGSLITAPIILLICEATPKVIAARANRGVAVLAARPMTLIYTAFRPVRALIRSIVTFIFRKTARRTQKRDAMASLESGEENVLLREQEFLSMVEEGHKQGAIHEDELELIRNVFDMDDRTVEDIQTPIGQVFSIPTTMTLKAAIQVMHEQTYSRIPVTGTGRSQIIGILYAKDLLSMKLNPEHAHLPVVKLMKKTFVVSPDLKVNALFRRMKKNKTHSAIVENPPGRAIGLVTMDDILDAMFEDLFEVEEPQARRNE